MNQKRRKLLAHQIDAVSKLRTGSILLGGVGSGKTMTSLAYYYKWECGGNIKEYFDEIVDRLIIKQLYVITTAKKRDSLDWEREAAYFGISEELHVDSWNNIKKYKDIKDAFFIFDEQKVVGYGTWAKSFIKIAKSNNWILVTATPGDIWMDYVPIFIANGFYKNKSEFVRDHVVYSTYVNYPKVDRYVNTEKLKRLKFSLIVRMNFERKVNKYPIDIIVPFDSEKLKLVTKERWNPFTDKPIRNASEAIYTMRRVVNSDLSRLESVKQILEKHRKAIIFYNFNYERDILRTLDDSEYDVAEYSGHAHQDIPLSQSWAYLVQYLAGAEAWECITTNTIIFYSLNYSYKLTTQSSGRIDRMTSEYANLYYYFIRSDAPIDLAIVKSQKRKTNFNEKKFIRTNRLYF